MNVIVIAVDALRSDALSCCGNPNKTSPNIDRLAREGAILDNFYSVGNCTHPGFTAMLTGMYPESTGVLSHWTRVAPPDTMPMLAEYFAQAGFRTAAMDNLYDAWRPNHPFYPWFRRGYDHYAYPSRPGFYKPGSDVSKLATEWLSSKPREAFLLFIHYWDTHAPYNKAPKSFYRYYAGDPCDPRLDCLPPAVKDSQRRVFRVPLTDPGYVVAAYHAEAAYVDWCIGKVLKKLEDLKLLDDSLVVVTSDHGDIMPVPRLALGRLWAFCHIGLSEDCLRIPLVIKGSGVERGVRVKERFQLIDLLPTLLDLAGIRPGRQLDGTSFSRGLQAESLEGRSKLFFSENTYQKQRAVLSHPWKYMRMEAEYNSMPPKSLFNLLDDPGETSNLSDADIERVASMDAALTDYVMRTTRGGSDPLKMQQITATI